MPVEDWQAGLRRQFGREQSFVVENLGTEPVFSEFAVTNPQSGGHYRVAIRGRGIGENFCSCPESKPMRQLASLTSSCPLPNPRQCNVLPMRSAACLQGCGDSRPSS
jgi:hypothetical protein